MATDRILLPWKKFSDRSDCMNVRPFRPLMFRKGTDHFYSPPFDTINAEDEKALKESEYNITHVTLPSSPESALQTLLKWRGEGILQRADQEMFIIIRQEFDINGIPAERTGMFCSVRIYPEADDIKPHEMTFPGPRKNRFDLMDHINCQPEPIFLITDSAGFAGLLTQAVQSMNEEMAFEEPAGVTNHVYLMTDRQMQKRLSENLSGKKAIVADGHHRLAASREIAHSRASAGKSEWSYIMAYLCPTDSNGLLIAGIHRIVKKVGNMDTVTARMNGFFELREPTNPDSRESIVCYDGKYYSLVPRQEKRDPMDDVDFGLAPDVVNRIIFRECFGFTDQQVESSVIYSHSDEDCIRMVDEGKASMCILMPKWNNEEFSRRVSGGGLLPQKSTYFYPKVPSGIALFEP